MSKEELNVFRKSFCTSARNRDGTLSVYISSSMKSIWEPLNKLSLIPLLLRQIKHYSKSPQKNRQHYRPNRAHKKRSETNFQWTDSKKLFDSGELGWAKSKIKIPQSLFGRRGQEIKRRLTPTVLSLPKIIKELSILISSKRRLESLPATKNHRVSEIRKMDPMLRYFLSLTLKLASNHRCPHIQLKLMRRQPQQGNADGVLVENN